MSGLTREHLEDFLSVAERRSIQAAARETGRSRATLQRRLTELERILDAPPLLQRGPGQREGVLTLAGEALVERAKAMLRGWDQWIATTRDEVGRQHEQLRIGALGGSLDLVVDLLVEMRDERPELAMRVLELPAGELTERVLDGHIDLGFGTATAEGLPKGLAFLTLGALDFVLIAPKRLSKRLPIAPRISDLDDVPLVVPRSGALRELLERRYHERGLPLRPVAEVESTPRMVELVSRGFGVAVVSRFRLAFTPPGVVVRSLADGPAPLRAGVFTRKEAARRPIEAELIARARARYRSIARRAR